MGYYYYTPPQPLPDLRNVLDCESRWDHSRWDHRMTDACVPCRLKAGMSALGSVHIHQGCGRTMPRLIMPAPRKCECRSEDYDDDYCYNFSDDYGIAAFTWYKESHE